VGFIVPKHRQSGVDRNRLKRRLREIVRVTLLAQLPPVDVVVRARPDAYAVGFDALAAELAGAGAKIARIFG
jgi:ribonuclease P protein component